MSMHQGATNRRTSSGRQKPFRGAALLAGTGLIVLSCGGGSASQHAEHPGARQP